MSRENRVPTNYAVTRKQKRFIARRKMEEEGKHRVCHHSYTGMRNGNFEYRTRVPSYFAENWREYAEAAI
jgi:hypothetical protein